jgi:hypothetical protein
MCVQTTIIVTAVQSYRMEMSKLILCGNAFSNYIAMLML